MLGVALAGCDPEVYSENHELRFVAPELQSRRSFSSGDRALQGSRVCMTLDGYRTDEGVPRGELPAFAYASQDDLHACYDERVVGSATLDADGCIRLDASGTASLELSRRECSIEFPSGDDRVAFEVVTIDDVSGAFRESVPFGDVTLEDLIGSRIDVVVPELDAPGVVPALGDPLYVLESEESVAAVVVAGAPLSTVAVTDASAVATARAGSPLFDAEDEPTTHLSFAAHAGDIFEVALQLPGGELEIGEVHVVAESTIASLELYPSMARLAGTDVFYGLGASAFARDADGNVLRGAAAWWRMLSGEGLLDTYDLDGDGVDDPSSSASIDDECVGARRGEERSATLGARLGDLVATVDVEWTCVEDHVGDGCGCRYSSAPTPVAVLFVFAYRRRRSPK